MGRFVILCTLATFCVLQATGKSAKHQHAAAERMLALKKEAQELKQYFIIYGYELKTDLLGKLQPLYIGSEMQLRNASMAAQDKIHEQVKQSKQKGKDAEKCYRNIREASEIILGHFDDDMKECSEMYIPIIRPFEEEFGSIIEAIEDLIRDLSQSSEMCRGHSWTIAETCIEDVRSGELTLEGLRKDVAGVKFTQVFDDAYNKIKACEQGVTPKHISSVREVEEKAVHCVYTA